MDIGLLRRFSTTTARVISTLPLDQKPNSECSFLTRIKAIIPDQSVADTDPCSDYQLSIIKKILRNRDRWLREPENLHRHYTMIVDQTSINIQYIKLAYALHRSLENIGFFELLFDVEKAKCVNLDSFVLSRSSEHNRSRFLDHYNFIGCDDLEREALKIEVETEVFFDPPARRIRGGSYGEAPLTPNRGKAPYFLRPELHSLYIHDNQLYSVMGLLCANQNPSKPFATRISHRNNLLRPLHIDEWAHLRKKNNSKNVHSYSLTMVGGPSYATPFEFIRNTRMQFWADQGVCPYELLLELIAIYLKNSTHAEFTRAFKEWCDQLTRSPTDPEQHTAWINNINCLYGQILESVDQHGTRRQLYLLDFLVALQSKKECYPIDDYFDRDFGDLVIWYCTMDNRPEVRQQRIYNILNLLSEHTIRIRDTDDDYFNLLIEGVTRYEKLARYLIDNTRTRDRLLYVEYQGAPPIPLTNMYQVLIPTLRLNQTLPYSITDFILSDDDQSLINLTDSVAYFHIHGHFLNVSELSAPREFTRKEMDRIHRKPYFEDPVKTEFTLHIFSLFPPQVDHHEERRSKSPRIKTPG
jgi:hypothetical protein